MTDQSNPSLVGGHAQYVKGAAEVGEDLSEGVSWSNTFLANNPAKAAVGTVTGSESWKASAEQDKQQGIDAMKAASAERDPQKSGFGKVEEVAGKAVGCEGMEQEGAESKK